MIVEEDENELATLNSRYFAFENSKTLFITMIVTRRCNFNCAYCYEELEEHDMAQSIFDNTVKFIISGIRDSHYVNVHISFFGGEPTLMAKEIICFMEKLHKANNELEWQATIRASMTTNGYLLSPRLIDAFVANKIIRYQITVDGLETEHNSSRYLPGKQGTWKKIIDNLQYFKTISDDEVSVLLRSNIFPANYKKIDEWLEYLYLNFGQKRIFNIYFETAQNMGKMNDADFALCNDSKEVILDVIERSKRWMLPLAMVSFKIAPFSMICYAARYFSFVIDFDGQLKKCTATALDHEINRIGTLTSEGLLINVKKSASWTSYDLKEKCRSCIILPICYGRKCPISQASANYCAYMVETYLSGLEYYYLT